VTWQKFEAVHEDNHQAMDIFRNGDVKNLLKISEKAVGDDLVSLAVMTKV